MDINDTFTNNFTLTNIIKGVKYRMSIAGKSEHFFSNSVEFSGQLYIVCGVSSTYIIINPRRACAARVTVVVLCVCVCVCVCVSVSVCPGRSSATHATKRQTRHTHGLSILVAPE